MPVTVGAPALHSSASRFSQGAAPVRHRQAKLAAGARRRQQLVRNLFTGIVQGTAELVDIKDSPGLRTVRVALPPARAENVQIGASVALNGTCLTVTAIDGNVLSFDMIEETLRRTNLGELREGGVVNFERSARVGDEIGGHNVSGHVHTVATVKSVTETENNQRWEFEVGDAARWMKYIFSKGFISVNGCSLTVGEVTESTFSVYLIPETLRVTTFGALQEGARVNIEIDAMTQSVVDTVEIVVKRTMEEKGL
ncbi:unnamed protein product [Pedinophyceae sp. YPF-701]|nr:unnamed protein product [Pedinophyceae sp. YPF-701]